MEVTVKLQYAHTGTIKAREQARLIQGQDVNQALTTLSLSQRKVAALMEKLLKSAVDLAEKKQVIDIDRLYVKSVVVNQGPHLKRYRPGAKGNAATFKKKRSHILMVLEERQGL